MCVNLVIKFSMLLYYSIIGKIYVVLDDDYELVGRKLFIY